MSTGGHQGESASDAAATYPSLSVKPLKSFDFSRWVKRFERCRVISGPSKQEGILHVNTVLYAMGAESEDILTSFNFAAGADQSNYDHFREKFDSPFNDNNNNSNNNNNNNNNDNNNNNKTF